jgi:hypothetical protein
MASTTKVCVVGTGPNRHVEVPCERSQLLHTFLWSQNLHVFPPVAFAPGFESIQLSESEDSTVVQQVLDTLN